MTLSYSAAARPAPTNAPHTLVSAVAPDVDTSPIASSSTSPSPVNHLVLDAGPLLSLTPLRHLAQTFHTTPLVLAELRDPKAREHWERLSLTGVDVKVETPSADVMASVIAFAKKTGDYAVLSQTDLSVVALTWQYEVLENGKAGLRTEPGQKVEQPNAAAAPDQAEGNEEPENDQAESSGSSSQEEDDDPTIIEEASRSIEQVMLDEEPSPSSSIPTGGDAGASRPNEGSSSTPVPNTRPALDDPKEDDEEDSESEGGEWITSTNLSKHRNRDLGLLPNQPNGKAPEQPKQIAAACMTGDFAVQNILLGIGLGLVGEGGKRISKVKSWVLRCHACFKLCKDPSKRFCPSCGNATLLRTTVTTSASTGKQRIHLKNNFQYHLRGTKYTIPDAKPGRSKGQQKGGTGLILREDDQQWQSAVRSGEIQRQKEERRIAKGALEGWNDPDWLPPMITVGMSGKGRSGGQHMPAIGHGRKNPNQSRRKR